MGAGRIIEARVVVDLRLVDTRGSGRRITSHLMSSILVIALASRIRSMLHVVESLEMTARLLVRSAIINCRSLRLAITTIRHALLQKGEASTSFINISLRVIGHSIRSQVPRVRSLSCIADVAKLLCLQVLLAEANLGVLSLSNSAHSHASVMLDSRHARRRRAL